MPIFKASRWADSDSSVNPAIIEIDPVNVSYYKTSTFGQKSTVIARSNIASVSVVEYWFFADVVIETYGGMTVRAQGFTKRDARTILAILS